LPEELQRRVADYVAGADVSGWANLSSIIGSLKTSPELRWANPLELKTTVEEVFTQLFGEKTAIKAKGAVSIYMYS
jgi:glutaminyl-tRNA synthetase